MHFKIKDQVSISKHYTTKFEEWKRMWNIKRFKKKGLDLWILLHC